MESNRSHYASSLHYVNTRHSQFVGHHGQLGGGPFGSDHSTLLEASGRYGDDLLVFGYPCTVFRDDDRARHVDAGDHLINWPNDPNVKIDRYDCRLLLNGPADEYESKDEAFNHVTIQDQPQGSPQREQQLTEAEREMENLLNEERYKDLIAEMEKSTEDYVTVEAAVPYDYVEAVKISPSSPAQESASDDDAEDSAFEPSPLLKFPPDMIKPTSYMQNVVIEKTALFVAQKGPQMEIIINLKQKSHKRFRFLDYGNPLHSYYKFILKMIRDKKYEPNFDDDVIKKEKARKQQKKRAKDSDQDSGHSGSDSDDDGDGHYLHPSLLAARGSTNSLNDLSGRKSSTPNECTRVNSPAASFQQKAPYKIGEEGDVYSELYNRLSVYMPKKPEPVPVQQPDSFLNQSRDGSVVTYKSYQEFLNATTSYPVVPPPPDWQPIIDRLADYVARNGLEFESMVRQQSLHDPRFQFLDPAHPYYQYYYTRCQWYQYELYVNAYYQQQQQPHNQQQQSKFESLRVIESSEHTDTPSSHVTTERQPVIDHPWCQQRSTTLNADESDAANTKATPSGELKPFEKIEGVTISFSLKSSKDNTNKDPTNLPTVKSDPAISNTDGIKSLVKSNVDLSNNFRPIVDDDVSAAPTCSNYGGSADNSFSLDEKDLFLESTATFTNPVDQKPEEKELLQNERKKRARMFLDSLKRHQQQQNSTSQKREQQEISTNQERNPQEMQIGSNAASLTNQQPVVFNTNIVADRSASSFSSDNVTDTVDESKTSKIKRRRFDVPYKI